MAESTRKDLLDTLGAIVDAATGTENIDVQEKLFNKIGNKPSVYFSAMRHALEVSLDLCKQIDKAYARNGKQIEFDGVKRMLRNVLISRPQGGDEQQ